MALLLTDLGQVVRKRALTGLAIGFYACYAEEQFVKKMVIEKTFSLSLPDLLTKKQNCGILVDEETRCGGRL